MYVPDPDGESGSEKATFALTAWGEDHGNTSYHDFVVADLNWDGRADTLERQMLTAMSGPAMNTPAAEVLYDAAKDAVKEGGKKFPMGLDLYCGVGTLTLKTM